MIKTLAICAIIGVVTSHAAYDRDMAKMPNDNHSFYDVDHRLWTDVYQPPSYADWKEYQGQIRECGTDCQITDVNFGDERFMMITTL